MRFLSVVMIGALATAACGDNIVPESGPASKSPLATSAVGGSQVSHSKSFMLVTNVSAEHSQIAKASKHTIKPGVGGE